MIRSLAAGILVAGLFALWSQPIQAQTVKVLVAQDDHDKQSLNRHTRIQRAVLNKLNQTLHAPDFQIELQKYGIGGMDVFDEKSVTLDFYHPDGTRRKDAELVTIAREVRNPKLDALVLYTLYAKRVRNRLTRLYSLHLSLTYRVLNLRDGRFLGGDNLDLDASGILLTGCAAGPRPDRHCFTEFLSENAEILARDAGNQIALKLAGLLGPVYKAPPAPGPAAPAIPKAQH